MLIPSGYAQAFLGRQNIVLVVICGWCFVNAVTDKNVMAKGSELQNTDLYRYIFQIDRDR